MVAAVYTGGVQAKRPSFWVRSEPECNQTQQKLNVTPETTCKSLCELIKVLSLQLQNSNVPLVQYRAR